MPQFPISMARIAAALGVSSMAVSLALRGRPGVSEELRERILTYAQAHGYEPDPVAAELMSVMRLRRSYEANRQLIAFINTFEEPKLLAQVPTFKAFFDGAAERGRDFGYTVEAFEARAPDMTGMRLSHILKARGVRGLLVGPRWRDEPDIQMDWQNFSVVLVGEVIYGPNIYRVCNHHIHTCALALQRLAERGYKRIGLALMNKYESSRSYDFVIGVEQFKREARGAKRFVDVWLYEEWSQKACEDWIRELRLDAVVSVEQEVGRTLVKINAETTGEPLGYANLDLSPDNDWSGVDQHSREIGVTAMDMLRNLLVSGERGVSPRPKMVLVDGEWRDGATTRYASAHSAI